MAHHVEFCVPPRQLGRSDVEFYIRENDELIGTLKISNGSVVWFPKNTREGHKISWKKFDELMTTNAQAKERR